MRLPSLPRPLPSLRPLPTRRQPRSLWRLRLLSLCALLSLTLYSRSAPPTPDAQIATRSVRVGGTTFRCNVVTLNIPAGRLMAHTTVARQGIGRTEPFESLLHQEGRSVVAAINGTFFDAYNKSGDKDPNMTLIRNGQVIHKGAIGTVVGFTSNRAVMGRLDMPIRGTIETPRSRRPDFWYAYWINRTPTAHDNICIFTNARGTRTRCPDGISVVVDKTVVTSIVRGDAQIPKTGFVINFRGGEEAEASKFPVGSLVGFRTEIKSNRDAETWQQVSDGIGAGPRLITDGRIGVDAAGEGFHDPKVLSDRGQRSAIGILRNGNVILVTVGGPTCEELAQIMQQLGAVQAMNLDGGASSALYCNGQMITHPGRDLSNALLFLRK
jgi:hypothetical protein